MSNRPSQPQVKREPRSPLLRLVTTEEDLEALALQVADDDCERQLALLFSEAGFRTLAFERAAPRLHLL